MKRLETLARAKVAEWRGTLGKHAPQARQILSKLLREKLVFTPETHKGQRGYRFHGEGTIIKLLSGVVPELASVHTGGSGVPNGIRTRVLALKGPRPRPLDDGDG